MTLGDLKQGDWFVFEDSTWPNFCLGEGVYLSFTLQGAFRYKGAGSSGLATRFLSRVIPEVFTLRSS